MIYIDKLTGLDAMYNRVVAFYSAPVTKFWMNLLFYTIFLIFHSYNLLAKMVFISPFEISQLAWTEIVIWIWLVKIHVYLHLLFKSWSRIKRYIARRLLCKCCSNFYCFLVHKNSYIFPSQVSYGYSIGVSRLDAVLSTS